VPDLPTSESCVALEREILQWFCAANAPETISSELKKTLAAYAWRDPDNRVVFESLTRLTSGLTPAQLREQLPAQATRMGFPDVNWGNYLTQGEPGARDIRNLVERLRAAK
jgi:hypothetical protein